MTDESTSFPRLREVMVAGLDVGNLLVREEKVSILAPAYRDDELAAIVAIIPRLVDIGCVEICFVGPEAERFHNAIDAELEHREMLDVVTTGDEDIDEAFDYFLFASCGGEGKLLALIAGYDDLATLLLAKVASYNGAKDG
ncbi:MAG: hypothetical protein AMXMBFR59_41180 [Rhodanobacteraceae bacterium]